MTRIVFWFIGIIIFSLAAYFAWGAIWIYANPSIWNTRDWPFPDAMLIWLHRTAVQISTGGYGDVELSNARFWIQVWSPFLIAVLFIIAGSITYGLIRRRPIKTNPASVAVPYETENENRPHPCYIPPPDMDMMAFTFALVVYLHQSDIDCVLIGESFLPFLPADLSPPESPGYRKAVIFPASAIHDLHSLNEIELSLVDVGTELQYAGKVWSIRLKKHIHGQYCADRTSLCLEAEEYWSSMKE
jgi:hypothetical protein